MSSEPKFILDLVTALGSATVGGFVANRLRQPVLLGYLLSGLIIGPFGFKLIKDVDQIQSLAEVGVAFLLFALGVEFSITELKRVKDIAIKGSLLQIGITTGLIALISLILGWSRTPIEGIFIGFLLSLSSTAVVLKTLTERGETNTTHGQVMLGILIAQDLALGLMLAILPALSEPGSGLGMALLQAGLKGVIFIAFAIGAGVWLVPPLMKTIAATESSELFLLGVIALCLGVALLTDALGLSIEMGAFIAGLMIAEIDYSDQALAKVLPLRDTFASLFFVSIGMLIEPLVIFNNLGVILGLVLMVMLGKALVVAPVVLGFGYSFKTAVIASLGLNQIGEFSFVLAQEGFDLGILGENKYFLVIGTTAITLVLTPVLLKMAPRFADQIVTLPRIGDYLKKFRDVKAIALPETLQNHVVVAGYGRVGQVLVNMLRNQGQTVLVIENSEAAIQRLRQQKISYIFGDADSDLVLEKVHLERALALAITLPDPASTRMLLQRALSLAPGLKIVVRAHENMEVEVLNQLGAWEVVQPEFEAALEIGANVLGILGKDTDIIQSVIRSIRAGRYRSVIPEKITNLELRALQEATENLSTHWVGIHPDSPLVGLTLAKANIRHLTGVTIMEIERENQKLNYPTPNTQFQANDRVLAVGSKDEIDLFKTLMDQESWLTQEGIRWVPLDETSPLVDLSLTPEELADNFTGIIAIRRQGNLYKWVNKSFKLKAGDVLLLQTSLEEVEKLMQERPISKV